MATAYAAWDYREALLWRGEVEDITFDWLHRMRFTATGWAYGVSATGASGSGWSAIGESASAFTFYLPAGLSALASGTAQAWLLYATASAGTGSASASALTGCLSTVRVSATGGPGTYLLSARMRTSSGRELRDVVSATIVG